MMENLLRIRKFYHTIFECNGRVIPASLGQTKTLSLTFELLIMMMDQMRDLPEFSAR